MQRKLIDQNLVADDHRRRFDVLRFDVTAFPDAEWEARKDELEGPNGVGSPSFDDAAHQRRRDAAQVNYVAEYWFDITSFFGR